MQFRQCFHPNKCLPVHFLYVWSHYNSKRSFYETVLQILVCTCDVCCFYYSIHVLWASNRCYFTQYTSIRCDEVSCKHILWFPAFLTPSKLSLADSNTSTNRKIVHIHHALNITDDALSMNGDLHGTVLHMMLWTRCLHIIFHTTNALEYIFFRFVLLMIPHILYCWICIDSAAELWKYHQPESKQWWISALAAKAAILAANQTTICTFNRSLPRVVL